MANTAVILINYNGDELILETLRSFAANTTEPYKLFIVQNGSTDGSDAKVEAEFSYLKPEIIDAGQNLGFGKAINLVLKKLSPDEFDYVALINPDILFSPGWLGKMTSHFETEPKLAAVGPLILYTDKFRIATVKTNNAHLYYHFPDYRYLVKQTGASGDLTKEILIEGQEYIRINQNEFSIYVAEREKEIDFKVYDESSNGFELEIDKFRADKSKLNALISKILYKLKIVKLTAKISKFSLSVDGILNKNQLYDVVNSLGAGIKSGKKLPENLQIGLTLEEADLKEKEVPFIHGACAVLKLKAVQEVGCFDEQFFVYYEDPDLSLSLRKAGYNIKVDPSVVIRHFERGVKSPIVVKLIQESQQKFIAKWLA